MNMHSNYQTNKLPMIRKEDWILVQNKIKNLETELDSFHINYTKPSKTKGFQYLLYIKKTLKDNRQQFERFDDFFNLYRTTCEILLILKETFKDRLLSYLEREYNFYSKLPSFSPEKNKINNKILYDELPSWCSL